MVNVDDYVSKNKLAPKNGGSQPYLSKTQKDEVVAHLMLKTYRCSYQIIEYIWKRYDVLFLFQALINGFTTMVLAINILKVYLISLMKKNK
ncbi:MAG: hypothetical protein ACJA2G_001906 [Cognaticolwellia sp.]